MNRDDAAALILAGKAQGHFERLREVFGYLEQLRNLHAAEGMPVNKDTLEALLDFFRPKIKMLDQEAHEAQEAVQRLLTDLEHPGARLARRVLFSLRAARAAWRASR